MDPRSIKPGIRAAAHVGTGIFHPTMRHPRTGEPLEAVLVNKHGDPVWPVMGGAPEEGEGDDDKDDDADEDSDEDEDEDSDDDDDSDDEDEDDDEEGKKGKGKKKGNAQAKIKALEEEKDRHFRKARKERKAREAAEAEVAALKAKYESGDDGKGKDGDKDTKPKVDDSKIKAAEAAAQKLRVENAFLRVNEISWIKPEQALALMLSDDDYEVEFDEDGKVDRKSLRAELKRFAKANPHLVKKPAAKTEEDDEGDASDSGSKSTAAKMNGSRKGKKNQPKTREELAKKFPALNRI